MPRIKPLPPLKSPFKDVKVEPFGKIENTLLTGFLLVSVVLALAIVLTSLNNTTQKPAADGWGAFVMFQNNHYKQKGVYANSPKANQLAQNINPGDKVEVRLSKTKRRLVINQTSPLGKTFGFDFRAGKLACTKDARDTLLCERLLKLNN